MPMAWSTSIPIGSPATAKNVITVGASEGDRKGDYPCDTSRTYTSRDAYQAGKTCTSMGGNQSSFLGTAGCAMGVHGRTAQE